MKACLEQKINILSSFADEGTTVLIKIDGERIVEGLENHYTVVLSGGKKLRNEFFRKDGNDLDLLIDEGIAFYNEQCR